MRAGTQNYNTDDVPALVNSAEELKPLKANEWASFGARFLLWSMETERPRRDTTSLKAKFGRLSNTCKPTGNPSCPQNVRCAKKISKGMLVMSSAAVAESFSEYEDHDEDISVKESTKKQNYTVIEVNFNELTNLVDSLKWNGDDGDALIEFVR